jgi:hypothetical protein
MAIFGYNGVGGAALNLTSAYAPRGSLYNPLTAVTGDVLHSISLYGSSDGNGIIELNLYSISGNDLVTRLGTIATITLGAVAGWVTTGELNLSLTNGVIYGIGIGFNQLTNNVSLRYNADAGMATKHNAAAALPATWVGGGKYDYRISVYATYDNINNVKTPIYYTED